MVLEIASKFEKRLSKAAEKRIWETFMADGTLHSARAQTLPYIIRRCEEEGIPYQLTADPKTGYHIKPLDTPNDIRPPA